MESNEKTPMNVDFNRASGPSSGSSSGPGAVDFIEEENVGINSNRACNAVVFKAHASKSKNWPRFKPILRHNIREDIPFVFQSPTRYMLFHCFYTAFFLLLNFSISCTAYFLPYSFFVDDWVMRANVTASPIWFFVWTVLGFVFYASLYKALTHYSKGWYSVFFVGTVVEILLSFFVAVGVPGSGLMGHLMAGHLKESWTISFLSPILVFAFVLNAILLISNLSKIHFAFVAIGKAGKEFPPPSSEASGGVGASAETRVEELTSLPEGSSVVVSEWRKAAPGSGSGSGGSYILYDKRDPGRAYWSPPNIADMIESGDVDPVTQELTISRLAGGSFVFGVVDKK